MTHKFSKRIANKTNRSVRKYAIGGRHIKADEVESNEHVLVFSAAGLDNTIIDADKLYVQKIKLAIRAIEG